MATIAECDENTLKTAHTNGKSVFTKLRKMTGQETRKTLQTIQLSSRGDGQMIGKENVKDFLSKCNEKIQLPKGSLAEPLQIYNDPSPQLKSTPKTVSLSNTSTQTDVSEEQISLIDKEAFDLMVNDSIPEQYWEELADQRRMALSEALHENEELNTSVCELKEENERLSKLASKAEYFAEVIKSFLGSNGDDEDKDKIEVEVEGTEKADSGEYKATGALEVGNARERSSEDKDTEQNQHSQQPDDVNEKI